MKTRSTFYPGLTATEDKIISQASTQTLKKLAQNLRNKTNYSISN